MIVELWSICLFYEHLTIYSFQLLERALLECGNNIDTAIKRLQELHLGAADATGEKMGPVEELGTTAEQGMPLFLAILIFS